MTDEVSRPPPPELVIRKTAMDMAINSRMGEMYNQEGKTEHNVERLVNAASKIADFLKGTAPATSAWPNTLKNQG